MAKGDIVRCPCCHQELVVEWDGNKDGKRLGGDWPEGRESWAEAMKYVAVSDAKPVRRGPPAHRPWSAGKVLP